MSELNADPQGPGRPKRAGWKQLRRKYESRFKSNFAPVRSALRRNELVASIAELFFSALVGAGKVALQQDRDRAPVEVSDDPDTPPSA